MLFALPTVTSRRMSGMISLRRERGRFSVLLTSRHHRPCHPGELVGQCDGGDLGGTPRQQRGEPWPMPGAVDLGVANDCECAGRKQTAQIAIALFADTAELVLAAAGALLGDQADPGREVPPDRKAFGSATLATRAVANAGPTPGIASSRLLVSLERCQALIMRSNSRI